MLFVIDSIIESKVEMQSTDAARPPLPQQDIANLRVGTKRVPFDRILRLFVKGQLEAMREVVLAVVVIKHFSGGCGLSAQNRGAFCGPSSRRQVAVFIAIMAERVFR